MAAKIRRDLYAEVTSRILARAERSAECGNRSALFRLQRYPVMVHARPRLANAAIRHVQTSARGWRKRA